MTECIFMDEYNCNPRLYVLILAALPVQINSFCVAIVI